MGEERGGLRGSRRGTIREGCSRRKQRSGLRCRGEAGGAGTSQASSLNFLSQGQEGAGTRKTTG